MGMSSGYHGNIMGASWKPWGYHGGIMGKPWEYLAKLMETSCENMRKSWEIHGNMTEISWGNRGNIMGIISWEHHANVT